MATSWETADEGLRRNLVLGQLHPRESDPCKVLVREQYHLRGTQRVWVLGSLTGPLSLAALEGDHSLEQCPCSLFTFHPVRGWTILVLRSNSPKPGLPSTLTSVLGSSEDGIVPSELLHQEFLSS